MRHSILLALGLLGCGADAGDSTAGASESTSSATESTSTDADQSTSDLTGDPTGDSTEGGDSDSESDGADPAPFTVELVSGGFSAPESAHFHAGTATWFVSNIAGESGAPDGVGWVTRVDRDGAIVAEKWAAGLDSPAGITSDEARLYVADINRVHVFDIETATEVETLAVDGAAFLNDLTLGPDGTLYVSDSFAQAIYALVPGEPPTIAIQDEALNIPNGVLWHDDRLLVGSIGPFMDFEADAPLHWLDVDQGELEVVQGVRGKFDGLVSGDGGIWMTDFRGALIWLQDGAPTVHDLKVHGMMSSADLGYDAEELTLVIPDLLGNQLAFVRLES